MFEAALPDPAALGWLLSAASGLSSSEWFDFFGLFFFFLTVVMAAFGKGGIGNDSLKRKRGKKRQVERGGVWDAASAWEWFVAVQRRRER